MAIFNCYVSSPKGRYSGTRSSEFSEDGTGQTVLHWAASAGKMDAIEYSLEQGFEGFETQIDIDSTAVDS